MKNFRLIPVLLLVAACGDSAPSGGGGAGGEGEGGAPDGGSGGGPSATRSVTFEVQTVDGPLEGALVALEGPDGVVAQGSTDANGDVLFENVPWVDGVMAVTAADRYARSHLNLSAADFVDGVHIIPLRIRSDFDTVTVAGAILNRANPDSFTLLSATCRNRLAAVSANSFSIEIESGTDCQLVFAEYDQTLTQTSLEQTLHGFSVLDVPAATSDVMLDVDFSTTEPTAETVGSVALPDNPESPLVAPGSFGFVDVVFNNTAYIAITTSSSVSNGRMHYAVSYLPDFDDALVYTQLHRSGVDGDATTLPSRTLSNFSGYPEAGDLDEQLLDVPVVVSSGTLADPISWEVADPSLDPTMLWHGDEEGVAAWTVKFPEGTTELVMPQLPDGIAMEDLFDGGLPYWSILSRDEFVDFRGRRSLAREFELVE